MAIIDLFKIVELKKAMKEKFGLTLHAHDACPSQYFNFEEEISDEVKNFLTDKLASDKLKPVFDADGKSFYIV